MARMKALAALLTAGVLSACSTLPAPGVGSASGAAAVAATPAEVKSLLWVGNSFYYYNNSMHGPVGQLLSAGGGREVLRREESVSPSADARGLRAGSCDC